MLQSDYIKTSSKKSFFTFVLTYCIKNAKIILSNYLGLDIMRSDKKNNSEKKPQANGDLDSKMTIYEYEQKYTKRQNVRGAKWLVRLLAMLIGVFLFFCLFSIL